jgi:hypothetical protein
MPWDIPAAISAVADVVKEFLYISSPEQRSKAQDNKERKDAYTAKKDWLSFSARMRRFLSGRKVIVFPFTLILLLSSSCAHLKPLTDDERGHLVDALAECRKEKAELLSNLLECLDRGEELSQCEPVSHCY